MKTEFIPLNYDYFDFEGKNYAKIYGKTKEGKKICLIDSFEPYFWAILREDLTKKQIDKIIQKTERIKLDIKGRKTKVEKVQLKEKKVLFLENRNANNSTYILRVCHFGNPLFLGSS